MLWFQDISFWNWSFKEYPYKKNNYPLKLIDSCIKLFLNTLYTPKFMVSNVPKKNVFIKLLSLGSSSFQIRKKLQKFFSDKLTSRNLKSFSPSRISYLKCYFQDLFTSISVVGAMLPIMERPNTVLMSDFVNI